jgi:hypothetical protein
MENILSRVVATVELEKNASSLFRRVNIDKNVILYTIYYTILNG